MKYAHLLDEYAAGPDQLAEMIADMTPEQINARPVPGKWSTREVVCHLADFEPIYADRIKRVLVEDKPLLMGGDPDTFAEGLGYDVRNLDNELVLMRSVRQQVREILSSVPEEAFQRVGQHSRDGEISIEVLLKRITGHIPHHVALIEEKKRALGIYPPQP